MGSVLSWVHMKKQNGCYKRTPKILASISGPNSSSWKGDKVGIDRLHSWVRENLKTPKICTDCGSKINIDLANISQKYKRDLTDWEWLCRKCHMIKDGRLKRFNDYGRAVKLPSINCRNCDKLFHPHNHKTKCCSISCGLTQNPFRKTRQKKNL